jgi:hypothetical protein
MGVENPSFINDLNPDAPLGTESISEGDNHIRAIKYAIKETFPEIKGEVTASHTELNKVGGMAADIAVLKSDVEDVNRLFAACTYNGQQTVGNAPGVGSVQWVSQGANGQPTWQFAKVNFVNALEPISGAEDAINGDVNARANVQVTAFATEVSPTGFVFPVIVDLEPSFVVIAFLQAPSMLPISNTGFSLAVFET